MQQQVEKFTPRIGFIVILLSFLLPFITVKCNGQEIAKIKGTDFVIGSEIEVKGMDELQNMANSLQKSTSKGDKEIKTQEVKKQEIERNNYIIIAFLATIIGAIISFIHIPKNRIAMIGSCIFGIAGLLGFIIFGDNSKIQAPLSVELSIGYYLCFLGFISIGGFLIYLHFLDSKNKNITQETKEIK